MSRSLADLRAQPPKARAEQSVTICLAPQVVAEVQALIQELDDIPTPGDDDSTPARKMGQGEDPRAGEIRARLAVLLDEMAEHEGELRLRASTDGDWRRWADAHPARDEDEPGHKRDKEVTGGYCNADDLLESLGTYAYAWNGDPLTEGDWAAVFADNVTGPDKKKLAEAVVTMHESRLDFRQWRSGLASSLSELNAYALRASSESVPDDSLVGNQSSSSEATTETATKSP